MTDDKKDEQLLSETLKSLGDDTRRSLLTRLCQEGPSRVTDLAAFYDMSLNAISKHIKILERCKLVSRTTRGRVHWIEADLTRIKTIERWFSDLKSIWEHRLDSLTLLIEEERSND